MPVPITDERFDEAKRTLEALRSRRAHWETQWEEAAKHLIPAHKDTFHSRGINNAMTPGRKNQQEFYDATAALALQRFSAVIESLVTPKNQLWHRLVPAEDELRKNRQVRAYLDRLNRKLFRHRYRASANYVGQSQKTYTGYGAYGNGFLFTDENPVAGGLRYKNLHLGEVYNVENHQGIVDTMYRVFYRTVRQLVQGYGEDAIPESLKRDASKGGQSETEHEVLHIIRPRASFDPRRVDAKGMPFESLTFLVKDGNLLRESGYRTFPLQVARYLQYTNEEYGRGPAQIVLPNIKLLNQEKKTVIKQGHRVVDPVLLVHDDGAAGTFSMKAGALNTGGVNAQGRALIQPLPVGNIAVGKDMMEQEQLVINDAFLITLFQILVENPQMTATEVLERAREKGMILAPTAGRLEAEYLGPGIERELDVLFQQGEVEPPPPALAEAGGAFQIEYDNPLSRMVRAENAAGFMRSLETALRFVEVTQNPEPLDWFNFDEAMPAIQDINGAPVEWTHTIEQVQAKRAERQQQIQTQQMIEAAPALAAVAKQANETPQQR